MGAARVYLNAEVLHPVSRLDRETSGVVVVAKNHESASKAQKAVSEKGAVKKKYLAFLEGFLDATATVSQPLADDKHSIVAIKTCCAMQKPSAKSACTIFRPISHSDSPDGDFTLCEVELLTGRKHQIRAHAQWLGHSVAGDKLYGPDETLWIGDESGAISHIMISPDRMAERIQKGLKRDFTDDEWNYYIGNNLPRRLMRQLNQ